MTTAADDTSTTLRAIIAIVVAVVVAVPPMAWASTITISGRCRSIVVTGAGARIRASTVDRISISGSNSRVSYRRSSTGGRAKVDVTGAGSKVTRRR